MDGHRDGRTDTGQRPITIAKKKKGSKCGDLFVVRTGNTDFCCKRLTSTEMPTSKYHIIRPVRFRWDPREKHLDPSMKAHHGQ